MSDDARWLVKELASTRALAHALGKPQLGSSSIEGGRIEEYDRDGNLSQVIGEQHDGTHTTSTVAGPVPPEPMPPSITVGIASAEVRANGKFADGAMSPMDLSHFAVHASRLEVFSPDNTTQKSTIQGESGDISVILIEPGMWTFGLVAVSKAGKWSSMSDAVTVEIPDYPSPLDMQQELIDLDVKMDGAITEAGTLGDRLDQAETDLDLAGDRLNEAGTRLDEVFGEVAAIPDAITAAKQAAINAAASDAQTKVDAASALANAQIAQIIAKGQSLVRNGDFEAGEDGWEMSGGSVVGGPGRSGVKSLVLAGVPSGNAWPKSEWSPTSTGRTYYVEYWVRVGGSPELTHETAFVVQTKNVAGATSSPIIGRVKNQDITRYEYVKRSVTYTVIQPDAVSVRFAPWAQGPTVTSYNIDDFLAVDVTEAKAAIDAAEVARLAAVAAQTKAGQAEDTANNALTMAGSKSRVYYSTSTPSGTAKDRDVWRQINATKDVVGEWFWDGTLSTPGWVKTLISSMSISNLDVGKLTLGTGIISDLVAEHIAGRSARFIQLDVSQLVAVTGTMSEAVITKLFTDVVMSRKITAQMLAIGAFDNLLNDGQFLDTTPAGWSGTKTFSPTGGRYGGGTLTLPASASQSGSYYLLSARTDERPVLEPGRKYRLSVQVRSTVAIPIGGVGFYLRLYAEGATTGNIFATPGNYNNTSIIPANTWGTITGVFAVPPDQEKIYAVIGVFSQSLFTTGPSTWSNASLMTMADGQLIVDGEIKAIHADLDSFAADTGFIARLVSKIVKADMFVGKEFIGGVFTGGTFQTSNLPEVGVKFDGQGFRAYGPNGGEPIVEMGAGGVKAFGITDPDTGEQLVTFDNEGGVAVQTLTVADTARIDGVFITGGDPLTEGHLGGDDPGSAGPVLNGRSLFGATYMNYVDEHPTVVDGNSWLTPLPHGPKVNAWRERTGTDYWDGIGGQTHSRMMVTTTLNAVANRAYLVTWQGPAIREVGTVGTGSLGAAVLRKSTPGGSVAAEQGTPIAGQRVYLPRGGAYFNPQGTTVLRCPEDIDEGKIMLGVDVYVNAGRQAESTTATGANLWSISAIDVGLRMSANDGVMVDLQKQGTATPTPPPPPAPNPVRQYTRTEPNTWHRSFNSNGTPYDLAAFAGKAVQGLGPGATGGAKGAMIGFPSFSDFAAGSKTVITKVEVFLYAEHWYAGIGGTLNLGYHGATGRPGAFAETVASIKSQKMKRGQGLWITLPSSVHAAVKSGAFRGVTLRPPSNSTSSAYYGYINPAKVGLRARVRVTIRK